MREGFQFSEVTKNFYSPDQVSLLKKTTVGIAGAGGLGSNCAIALVRSGFENFVICDFDVVCASNLNRQAYGFAHIGKSKVECLAEICRDINPSVKITTVLQRIDAVNVLQIFSECVVIIEAFDDAASKAMLFNAVLPTGKLLVGASGIAGYGNSDSIITRKVAQKAYIVGDVASGVSEELQPYAPRVMIAAAKMSDIVLSEVLGDSPFERIE